MKITRDSAVLWLGVAGGVVMYLSNMPPPWEWNYQQWVASIGVAITGCSLKLQNSALPSKSEVRRGFRDDGRAV